MRLSSLFKFIPYSIESPENLKHRSVSSRMLSSIIGYNARKYNRHFHMAAILMNRRKSEFRHILEKKNEQKLKRV